jgi:large subunit ribosomal protein L27
MAHHGGKTKAKTSGNARPKYLGIKLFSGQEVKTGSIIVRQRGTRFLPGKNVARGKDDTLYSTKEGIVSFVTKRVKSFDGKNKKRKVVNVN